MKALVAILFAGLSTVGLWCLDSIGREAADEAVLEAMDEILESGVQPGPIRLRRVASTDQIKSPWQNSYSPDGRLEAFPSSEDGFAGVAVRDLETLSERMVTRAEDQDEGGASMTTFSPDGSRIAYRWYAGDRWVVKTVGLDGTNASVVFDPGPEEQGSTQLYDWHPDGNSIVIGLLLFGHEDAANGRQSSRVISVPLEGGEPNPLWTEGVLIGNRDLRYAPDGKSVAFTTKEDAEKGLSDVHIRNLETGDQSLLLGGPSADQLLDWQPDGTRVYVASNRSGSEAIWAVPVTDGRRSGKPVLIRRDVHGLVNESVLSVDVVGEKLFYITSIRTGDLFTVEIDTATGRLLSEAAFLSRVEQQPEWSPDGRYLATAYGPTVIVHGAESDIVREYVVPGNGLWIQEIRWTYGSDQLLVHTSGGPAYPESTMQLVLDLESGAFHVNGRESYTGMATGADGSTSYRAGAETGVYVHHIDADETTTLVASDDPTFRECAGDHSNRWSSTTLSANDSLLAFTVMADSAGSEECLGVVSTKGGPMRWLDRHAAGRMQAAAGAFTADGAHVLFLTPSEGSSPSGGQPESATDVWMISVDGRGAPKKILTRDEVLRGVSLHPDGRRLAFTTWHRTHELWEMEGMHDIVE